MGDPIGGGYVLGGYLSQVLRTTDNTVDILCTQHYTVLSSDGTQRSQTENSVGGRGRAVSAVLSKKGHVGRVALDFFIHSTRARRIRHGEGRCLI